MVSVDHLVPSSVKVLNVSVCTNFTTGLTKFQSFIIPYQLLLCLATERHFHSFYLSFWPDWSTRVLECMPASAGYHFSTIQANQFEKVPNYFGIGQTIVTLHDSMHNVNREHIAEVKEK